jgi:hypothetical protein
MIDPATQEYNSVDAGSVLNEGLFLTGTTTKNGPVRRQSSGSWNIEGTMKSDSYHGLVYMIYAGSFNVRIYSQGTNQCEIMCVDYFGTIVEYSRADNSGGSSTCTTFLAKTCGDF